MVTIMVLTVVVAVTPLPEHLGAWIAAALGLVLIASTVGGVAVKLGNQAIVSTVKEQVHAQVPKAVASALREVNSKLDGIQTELGVVRRLDREVSEMHGWMKASQRWDGQNRRDET